MASINTKKKTVSMLSIPRDLYVAYPNGEAGRINELYQI
jgi:anionic cell wall polymer biosynthesis LytR-Cps2A-Psr (LCP) family protein